MPSQLDDLAAPNRMERGAAATFLVLNRRLHYFLGLYLLFFCWLFAFTGLLLNHSRWQFAQFWPNRVQTTSEHQVATTAATPIERAREVMRQLDLDGEIQWPAAQPTAGSYAFQVSRPGRVVDVKVDFASGHATLQRNDVNAWGVMHVLHTFTGVRAADTMNTRDWTLTSVWAFSMDAVAAGLIVMVFSSYLMWYRLKTKRRGGAIALFLGGVTCAAFVGGLSWLF
jgi:hypothetical protein